MTSTAEIEGKNEINVLHNSIFAGNYSCFTNLHVILIGMFSPKLLSKKLTDKADLFSLISFSPQGALATNGKKICMSNHRL